MPLLAGREPPFIDLGSGAGFPGLVLAIASGNHVHLVEADRRKCAFLREAARATGAPVSIHAERIEAIRLPRAAAVTARALAPLPKLLKLAQPLLRPDGVLIAMKGKSADAELTAARPQWRIHVVARASRTDSASRILEISDICRAE